MEPEKDTDKEAKAGVTVRAIEEHAREGQVTTVRCDRCGELIVISAMGETALRLACPCGRYDDNLRGL